MTKEMEPKKFYNHSGSPAIQQNDDKIYAHNIVLNLSLVLKTNNEKKKKNEENEIESYIHNIRRKYDIHYLQNEVIIKYHTLSLSLTEQFRKIINLLDICPGCRRQIVEDIREGKSSNNILRVEFVK